MHREGLTGYGDVCTTIVVSNPFHYLIESQLLETKCMFKQKDMQMFGFKLTKNKFSDVAL